MTKEDAKDLLDNLIGMIEDNHNSDYDTAFQMAIKALEQEPKWISVRERLPENSGNYLITYYLPDEIDTQEAVYVEEEDKWYDTTDIEISLAVIAWMPLPKPYYPHESE